jgi:hypothetical protein
MRLSPLFVLVACASGLVAQGAPPGFVDLWNGRDLAGWHGQRGEVDSEKIAAMPEAERAKLLAEDAAGAASHWRVEDGAIVNDGEGPFLTTDRDYRDIELQLDYRTVAGADSGIYLRGTPQVQIWDPTEAGGKWKLGADKGSGGLWNNADKGAWNGERHARFPLVLADRPFGQWNHLRIVQVGERTSVWLNDQQVVDWTVMENYWDHKRPLRASGPIQLQTHGGEIRFRALRLRELTAAESDALLLAHAGDGFQPVFDGKSLDGWQGDTGGYEVVDGAIRCRAGSGGNLFTRATYRDFAVRLRFRLPPGGNNGLAIRYPGSGDAAYEAIEVQVLDDSDPKYATLQPWQFHGSLYALVPAHRGYLRPQGEWNYEEVVVRGARIAVTLNGTTIVDADVAAARPQSDRAHPGKDRREGAFGFCGHQDPVEFRDIAIKIL